MPTISYGASAHPLLVDGKPRWRIKFFATAALGAILALMLIFGSPVARAWTSEYSTSNTLVGYNYDYFQFGYFPWTLNSSISYTKVWEGGVTYARIDLQSHQVKTNTDWSGYSGLLGGYAQTTFYSDSYYLYTYIYGNGSCLVPPWTYWFCSSGTSGTRAYGQGRGDAEGHMSIGGGGWGTYGGSYSSGSFYFAY